MAHVLPGTGEGGSTGGLPPGGGEPPGISNRPLFRRGFYTVGFAVAAGLGLVLLYLMVFYFDLRNLILLNQSTFLVEPSLATGGLIFVSGALAGLTISVIYNTLLMRRHAILGLEVHADA